MPCVIIFGLEYLIFIMSGFDLFFALAFFFHVATLTIYIPLSRALHGKMTRRRFSRILRAAPFGRSARRPGF
jgi:hypothetical protein